MSGLSITAAFIVVTLSPMQSASAAERDMDANDHEVLAAIFASRVSLAKKTEKQAVIDAREEWRKVQVWVKASTAKEGSFVWYCDEFDLDVGAVRRAIVERRK